jgi:hypothetical protein
MSATLNFLRQLDRTLSFISSSEGFPRNMDTTKLIIEDAIKELTTPLQKGSGRNAPPVTGYLLRYMTLNRIDNANTDHMIQAAKNAIQHIMVRGRSVNQTICPEGSDFSFIKATTFMPLMYTEVDTMFKKVMHEIHNRPQMPNNTEGYPPMIKKVMHEIHNEPQMPNNTEDYPPNMSERTEEPLDLKNPETYLRNMITKEFTNSVGGFHIECIHPSWLTR